MKLVVEKKLVTDDSKIIRIGDKIDIDYNYTNSSPTSLDGFIDNIVDKTLKYKDGVYTVEVIDLKDECIVGLYKGKYEKSYYYNQINSIRFHREG